MREERVCVVDVQDNILRVVTRDEMRAQNLLHRSVAVLCRNSAGEVYLHRRSDAKDLFPGLHDMFVGGVVSADEDYDAAARREIGEELGIDDVVPRFLFRATYEGPRSRALINVYEAQWDGPIQHRDHEIVWGRFFSPEALSQVLADGLMVVPDGAACYAQYLAFVSSDG